MKPESRNAAVDMAFRTVFGVEGHRSQHQMMVYAFLDKFCRARKSTFDSDPRLHAFIEGRREVFLEINKRLTTAPPTINAILGITTEDDTDGSE